MELNQRQFFSVRAKNIDRNVWLTRYDWGIHALVEETCYGKTVTTIREFRVGGRCNTVEDCEREALLYYGIGTKNRVYVVTHIINGLNGKLLTKTYTYADAQSAWHHFKSVCNERVIKGSDDDMDKLERNLLDFGRGIKYEYSDSDGGYFIIGISPDSVLRVNRC